jgi:hypothetical protein
MMADRFTIEERTSEDGYEYWWVLVDTVTGEEVGCDGGEPEDMMLVRDLAWVETAMNKLAKELEEARDDERAAVVAWLRAMHPERPWMLQPRIADAIERGEHRPTMGEEES